MQVKSEIAGSVWKIIAETEPIWLPMMSLSYWNP